MIKGKTQKIFNELIVTSASKKDPKKVTVTFKRIKDLFPKEKTLNGLKDGSQVIVTINDNGVERYFAGKVSRSKRNATVYGSLPSGFNLPKVGKHITVIAVSAKGV